MGSTKREGTRDVSLKHTTIQEQLDDLCARLNSARSVVYLSGAALSAGDSDLEMLSGTALKECHKALTCIYDDVYDLRYRIEEVAHG